MNAAIHRYIYLAARSMMILFVLLLVQACSMPRKHDPFLQSADSLMKLRPDSALVILESISPDRFSTLADRAKYALLLTQARERNYMLHTNDSLIRIAVNYYDSIGDEALAAEAHYYLGSVYRDKNEAVKAFREYMTILVTNSNALDYDLKCLLQSGLGNLYFEKELYDKSDMLFRQAELLADQHNDSIRLATILTLRGQVYMGLQNLKNAKKTLQRAYEISCKINDRRVEHKLVGALSTLYTRMNMSDSAVYYAKQYLQLTDSGQLHEASFLLGDAYFRKGEHDSAVVYITNSILSDNCYTKKGAYMRLSDIAKSQGNYANAVLMQDSVTLYNDSIMKQMQALTFVEMQEDTYSHALKNDFESMLSTNRYLIGGLVITIGLGVALYIYKRKELSRKIETVQSEHEMFLKNAVKGTHDKIHVLGKEVEQLRKALVVKSDIHLKFTRIIDYYKEYAEYQETIEQEDWLQLLEVSGLTDFARSLQENLNLAEKDVYLYCLLYLEFSAIEISVLLKCSRDNVYKKKKTIEKSLSARKNIAIAISNEHVVRRETFFPGSHNML